MLNKLIGILISIQLLFACSEARVFVTHGFNASHTSWYQPGGDFYEAVKKAAAQAGHSIAHFSWSQRRALGYTYQEHLAGGLLLASQIIKFCENYTYDPAYPNDDEIIVVAHSFGGLVSYHASKGLEMFHKERALLENKEYCGITGLFKKAWCALAKNWLPAKPLPVIHKLFTLGTPHQEEDVLPSPVGVKKIYNIYSPADFVANELIAGNPLLPKALQRHHGHAYNVLLFGISNDVIHGFGHSEIHHPAIGSTIFDLGEYVDVTHARDDKHSRAARHVVYTIEMPEELVKKLATPTVQTALPGASLSFFYPFVHFSPSEPTPQPEISMQAKNMSLVPTAA